MAYNITDSADIASKGVARIGNNSVSGLGTSSRTLPSSEIPKQGKETAVRHGNPLDHNPEFSTFIHVNLKEKRGASSYFCLWFAGIPDFAEVYSFIGSVFDPETKGHVQKLKEMDPINFETVS